MKDFLARMDDRLNPVAVKELRQAVRGRFITTSFITYTSLLLIILFLNLPSGNREPDGQAIMIIFMTILLIVGVLVIPVAALFRMGSERDGDNLDLLYISTLPPRQIITGKFQANFMLVLMFQFATWPFLAVTGMMRGTDLPTMCVIMVLTLLIAAVCLNGAMLLAGLPITRVLRILIGLIAAFFMLPGIGISVGGFYTISRNGIATRIFSGELLGESSLVLLAFAAVWLVTLQLGVAMIQPYANNRIKPIRIMLTCLWLIGLLIALVAPATDDAIEVWCIGTTVMICLAALFSTSERESPNSRLRREIPQATLRRLLVLPFFTGAANGLVWAMLIFVLTCIIAVFHAEPEISLSMLGLGLYVLGYVLIGHRLYQSRFFRHVSKGRAWLLPFFLMLICLMGSMLAAFFTMGSSWDRLEHSMAWYVLNPLILSNDDSRPLGLIIATAWFSLGLVVRLGWFKRAIADFKPAVMT